MLPLLQNGLRRLGLELTKHEYTGEYPPDFDAAMVEIVRAVRPYTMTGIECLWTMVQAVRYVQAAQIPGAIVECGVWRGGGMMAAAMALLQSDCRTRDLYLFDTFEGMTPPSTQDRDFRGRAAATRFSKSKTRGVGSDWCFASLEDVQKNMARTGYDAAHVHFVQGQVEATVPQHAPAQIALLRLDTDWYVSTKHELNELYPRLMPGGVLIVDDYGYWRGSRQAVDEYFNQWQIVPFLQRIDFTARLYLKPR